MIARVRRNSGSVLQQLSAQLVLQRLHLSREGRLEDSKLRRDASVASSITATNERNWSSIAEGVMHSPHYGNRHLALPQSPQYGQP
jgi:hypothetical protein